MTVKMSERDKKILTGLIIGVFFFVLLWFGVRPLFDGNQKIKQQITETEVVKLEKERKVNSLTNMQYILEDNQKAIEEAKKQFYPEMGNTEIDRTITGQVLDSNLFPRKLSIDVRDEEYTSLKSYEGIVWGVKNLDHEVNEGPFYGVRTARVSLTVYGSYEELWKFLNRNINSERYQRVCRYQFSENRISDEKGEYALDMEMELYMLVEETQDE